MNVSELTYEGDYAAPGYARDVATIPAALPMDATVLDVLRHARDTIAREGVWCKGDYIHTDGTGITRCAVGAIQEATRDTLVFRFGTPANPSHYAVDLGPAQNPRAESAAINALALALDSDVAEYVADRLDDDRFAQEYGTEEIITSWNDDEDTRKEDVLSLFDKAIVNVANNTVVFA